MSASTGKQFLGLLKPFRVMRNKIFCFSVVTLLLLKRMRAAAVWVIFSHGA